VLDTGTGPPSTPAQNPVKPVDRPGRQHRPLAARALAAASVLLTLAGVTAIVLAPQQHQQQRSEPVRIDVPLATVETPAPAPATGISPPTVKPVASPDADAWPDIPPLPASRPVRVSIPVLGVTSSVMDLGLNPDGSMELPPGAYPVGWYDKSPTPGQLGPAVLVGHVDWGDKNGVFFGLRVMRPGDRVVVDRADGSQATFRVGRVERHAKDDFPTGEVYGDVGWAGLRLITCGGKFDERTGNYEDNVIVFARLVSTTSTQ
jgi:sortase (surface protein transpeptidase)